MNLWKKMWQIGEAIIHRKCIEVNYKRVTNNKESQVRKRKIKTNSNFVLGILFLFSSI